MLSGFVNIFHQTHLIIFFIFLFSHTLSLVSKFPQIYFSSLFFFYYFLVLFFKRFDIFLGNVLINNLLLNSSIFLLCKIFIWDKVFKSGLNKFVKDCLLQNLLSPLLNSFSHIFLIMTVSLSFLRFYGVYLHVANYN